MAYSIIKPRQGVKSLWNTYKSRIYKKGEMLVESPESGVGSGPVNIKFGDGATSYENLPYAVEAPTEELIPGGTAPMSSGAGYLLKQLIEAIDLSGLSLKGHKHTKSEITDFPTTMAPTAHTHAASDITGLGAAATKGVDTSAASGSSNLITSGAVYSGLSSKANSSHNQAASTITAGTFGGKVQANATAAATLTNAQVRDIYAGTTDMTPGSTSLTTGTIYVFYE